MRVLAALVAGAGATALPAVAAPPFAREVNTPQTTVELIAAAQTVPRAGGVLWVGIRFRLQDKWHVYWQNPGDSGGPPTVLWHVPEGVVADGIQWPMPKRIRVGPLVNYGYEGDVVLPVRLLVAPRTAGLPGFGISAELRWIACRELCVSGKATLGFSLPLGKTERAGSEFWARRITAARAAVPAAAPPTWRASVVSEKDSFVLTVRMDRPAAAAVFFPLDESQIDDSAPQEVASEENSIRVRLRKSDQLVGNPQVLRGVVAVASGPNVVITAPVDRRGLSTKSPRSDEE